MLSSEGTVPMTVVMMTVKIKWTVYISQALPACYSKLKFFNVSCWYITHHFYSNISTVDVQYNYLKDFWGNFCVRSDNASSNKRTQYLLITYFLTYLLITYLIITYYLSTYLLLTYCLLVIT